MTVAAILQIVLITFMIGLAAFCFTLTRRLRKLNDLETGLGGAIAVMASEIDRLEKSILLAKSEAMTATQALSDEIDRAKEERAFWVLQKKFSDSIPTRPTRLQRRRREEAGINA